MTYPPHTVERPQDRTHRRVELSRDGRIRCEVTTAPRWPQALILQHCRQRHPGSIVKALLRALRIAVAKQLSARQVLARLR